LKSCRKSATIHWHNAHPAASRNSKKLVSAASFRLKGSGWYETDFKTGGKKQLAESDSAADSNSDSDKSKSDTSVAKSEPVKSDTTEKKTAKESKKDINKRENTTSKSGSKAVDV